MKLSALFSHSFLPKAGKVKKLRSRFLPLTTRKNWYDTLFNSRLKLSFEMSRRSELDPYPTLNEERT